ncbi:semialdehyde dehydrogenase [Deinococcus sp.]|uniref:semialdehyde dehydrogenase n=1 Tax=Deinococcus sp. TaxID=47478 RepID=UPI003B5CDEFB
MSDKFAFLIHPRNAVAADMGKLFGAPLGWIPDSTYAWAMKTLPVPPLITGNVRFEGHAAQGTLITVPLSAPLLLGLPRRAVQAKVHAAVDRARDLGASIVGLGGLTAPVTSGGKSLAARTDIGVTNGNAFTAAMTYLGIERLLPQLPAHPVIALVGASGSVGSCVTHLLARRDVGELLLIARHEGRLEDLRAALPAHSRATVSTQMDDVRKADLVVLLTSSSEALLGSQHLKAGAIVLDDTQPRNTDPALLTERPDVMIIDGGLVEIPGMSLRGTIGLPRGLAYACFAETMLLSLSGHTGHFSLGLPSVPQAEMMLALAHQYAELGFHLAPFHSFGKPLAALTPAEAAQSTVQPVGEAALGAL